MLLFAYYWIFSAALEYKFQEGRGFCLFSPLLCYHGIFVDEWMNPSQLCISCSAYEWRALSLWVGWGGTISPGSARVTSLQDWALHSLHFLESIYPNNSRAVCPSFMVSSQSHSASLPISLSFLCVETPYILYPGFSISMSHLFTDFQPSLPNSMKQGELRPKCVVK